MSSHVVSATSTNSRTTYRAVHSLTLPDCDQLTAVRALGRSPCFSARDDPHLTSFLLELDFGSEIKNLLATRIIPVSRVVKVLKQDTTVYDDKMTKLIDLTDDKPVELERDSPSPWRTLCLLGDIGNKEFLKERRILVEIEYEVGAPWAETA